MLCDCFKDIFKRIHFYQDQMSKTNFEIYIKCKRTIMYLKWKLLYFLSDIVLNIDLLKFSFSHNKRIV